MTRKTEPTSTFIGMAARRWRRIFVAFFPAGVKRPLKLAWLLVLFAAGFGISQSLGVTNNNEDANFETPPLKLGSLQWEENQRAAKARQENYRRRVPIPAAVFGDLPVASDANISSTRKIALTETHAPTPAPGKFFKSFFFTIISMFAGILLVKKLAPEFLHDLNQRFNPWALIPIPERAFSEIVRAEEKPFDEFLTTFRAGPAMASFTDVLGKADQARGFYELAVKLLGQQRKLLQDIVQESGSRARQKFLLNLCAEMAVLKDAANFPAVLPVWQVASALEGLLKQLTEKMGNVTASTLRAVVGGVDLLDDLCAPGLKPDLLTDRPLKFLVVDDDLISRHAMSLALKKAFSQPDLVTDGETALNLIGQQAYDVIFLDVQMPGMDGFELCTKIRTAEINRTTPVVFVTSQDDFDARARSTLSGGNDLMGKPFLTFEITVKALTLGLQGRLHGQTSKPLRKLARSKDGSDSAPTLAEVARPITNLPSGVDPAVVTTALDKFTNAFLTRAANHLGPLKDICQKTLAASDETVRQTLLVDGFLRINSLISKTGGEIIHPAYQMSIALERLFRKLLEDAKYSSPSTLATITLAVDLLEDLCVPGLKADLAVSPPIELLVVDDDLVARRAIVGALQTTFKRPENVENGEAALVLAMERPFDVIFLDVVMPGMDGFEVCSKIRDTVANHATPVVFVTSKNDFDAQAEMRRNSGNDLLGKPFLTSEITVKALTFALRGRLDQVKCQLGV